MKAIAPGAIMTPMVEGSLRQMGGDNWEEVGYLVAFLLSNHADFINGVVVPIDGGQSYKY